MGSKAGGDHYPKTDVAAATARTDVVAVGAARAPLIVVKTAAEQPAHFCNHPGGVLVLSGVQPLPLPA